MCAAPGSVGESSEMVEQQRIPEAMWIALSTVCQLERTVAMAERVSTGSRVGGKRTHLECHPIG